MKRFHLVLAVGLCAMLAFPGDGHGGLGMLKKAKQVKDLTGETAVDELLAQVEQTRTHFQGATKCISVGRDVLFDIAATSEKKEQLKAKEADLAAAELDEDKERITVEIQTLKDEEIQRAHESGELEKKKLSQQQLKNTGKLMYNFSLAILKDKAAIKSAGRIKGEGQEAIQEVMNDKLLAAKAATKVKDLNDAIQNDVPAILKEGPAQLKTLEAFLSATQSLKKSNKLEKMNKPKEGDEFEEIEF